MSADNWTYCPKCAKADKEEYESIKEKIDNSYGKIPQDEYILLVKRFENGLPELHQTLAEYYEIGILNNEFFIRYRGKCDKCKFEYSYNLDENLKL
jgi:rubredoxin